MAEEISNINRLLSASRSNPGLVTLEATVMHGFEPSAWAECINKCNPVDIFRGNGRIFFNIPVRDYEKSMSLRAVDNLFLVCHTFKKFKSCRNSEADLSMFKELASNLPWRKYVELWIELSCRVGNLFAPCRPQRKSCKPAVSQRLKESTKLHDERIKPQSDLDANGHHPLPVNPFQTDESQVINKLDLLFQEALNRLKQGKRPRPIDPTELKEIARRKIVAELESLAGSLNSPLTTYELSLVSFLLDTIVQSRHCSVTNNNEPFGYNFSRYYDSTNKSDVEIYSELDDLVTTSMNSVFSVEVPEEEDISARSIVYSHSEQLDTPGNVDPGLVSTTDRCAYSCEPDHETQADKSESIEKMRQNKKNAQNEEFDSLKCKVTLCSNDRLACTFPEAASAIGEVLSEQYGWIVDHSNYELNIFFVFEHGSGFVTLSLTKPRRSVVDYGLNTLSSALCYNLVRLADPRPGDIILDPMCGSCSISIEGARAFPATFHIGGDLNERALLRTKNNIQHAMKKNDAAKIDAFRWNVKRGFPFRASTIDVIVTDLPTGLGNKNNVPLYTITLRQLGKITREGTGRAVFFTADMTAFSKALGANSHLWEEVKKFEVFQKNNFAGVCLLKRKH